MCRPLDGNPNTIAHQNLKAKHPWWNNMEEGEQLFTHSLEIVVDGDPEEESREVVEPSGCKAPSRPLGNGRG